MFEQFYLDYDSVPEMFKTADRYLDEQYPENGRYFKPSPKPMPYITHNPNADGPLYVTEEYEALKSMQQKAQHKHNVRARDEEFLDMMVERDRLKRKISSLNIRKKADAEKIVEYNVRLRDLENAMYSYRKLYNIKRTDYVRPTGFAEEKSVLKDKIKKMVKKVKKKSKKVVKFIKEHGETIGQVIITASYILVSALTISARLTAISNSKH